jgi:DNA polymerase III delta prime subunit
MNKLITLLFAAAVGSAATYFFMDARQSATKEPAAAAAKAAPKFAGKAPAASAETPAGETSRKSGSSKFGGKSGGFLPEEIDGVTPEQLNKCRNAMMKTFQDEDVKAARAKLTELFKESQYASDDEKKGMARQFEDAQLEIRKATKVAMMAADADITDDLADKVLDAAEERMKQRRAQFQQNGKKK